MDISIDLCAVGCSELLTGLEMLRALPPQQRAMLMAAAGIIPEVRNLVSSESTQSWLSQTIEGSSRCTEAAKNRCASAMRLHPTVIDDTAEICSSC